LGFEAGCSWASLGVGLLSAARAHKARHGGLDGCPSAGGGLHEGLTRWRGFVRQQGRFIRLFSFVGKGRRLNVDVGPPVLVVYRRGGVVAVHGAFVGWTADLKHSAE
jgi:hypothetical protein